MIYTVDGKVLVGVTARVEADSPEAAVLKAQMGEFVKNPMGFTTDWEADEWLSGVDITEVSDENEVSVWRKNDKNLIPDLGENREMA